MTIQFEVFMKWLESFRTDDPLTKGEPIYIRMTKKQFMAKDSLSYTSEDGTIFVFDIDENDELCGIEIN